jgi:hypothetical protein
LKPLPFKKTLLEQVALRGREMTGDGEMRTGLWLREPLVHFLLAGCAIFLWSSWQGTAIDPSSRTIRIDEPQVERLAQAWTLTWRRSPNQAEIDGLIRDFVKEEVYYREALRLGLDRDDAVIRRRLMAKMQYLAAAQAANIQPSDADLQQWLDRNRARYAPDAVYSFDQVFVAAADEVVARSRATAALDRIRGGADWRSLSDPIGVPASVQDADTRAVTRLFGAEFAAQLGALPRERWSGPVASGYGLHLVRLRKADATTPVRLVDVRPQVESDWRTATTARRQQEAYQALLDQYQVRITLP